MMTLSTEQDVKQDIVTFAESNVDAELSGESGTSTGGSSDGHGQLGWRGQLLKAKVKERRSRLPSSLACRIGI